MKNRAAIYQREAAEMLHNISLYPGLTEKQLCRFFPEKEATAKTLLAHMPKEGRTFCSENGRYYANQEVQNGADKDLLRCVWVLLDFIDQVEYHTAGEFPAAILCFANTRTGASHTPDGILLSDQWKVMTTLLEDAKTYKKEHFLFGEGYEHFYFLTNDYHGETLLWLLCHPEIIGQLNAMLLQELQPPCRNAFIENDARTDAGAPILFCYLPDLPRLFRFLSALELLQMKGAILCFDFQADALRPLCGDRVELQTIDFAEFERRFLTSP